MLYQERGTAFLVFNHGVCRSLAAIEKRSTKTAGGATASVRGDARAPHMVQETVWLQRLVWGAHADESIAGSFVEPESGIDISGLNLSLRTRRNADLFAVGLCDVGGLFSDGEG